MQSQTMACFWQGREAVCPRPVHVMEVRGEYPRRRQRARHAEWVLDYEFTSHGRYRVLSTRVPWRPRLPRTAHLYSPGLDYWEDTRAEQGHRHSAWVCFAGGEAAGLGDLVHARLGYARFIDAHDQLGTLLHGAALSARREGDRGFWLAQAALSQMVDLLLRSKHEADETWRLPAVAEAGGSELVQTVDRYLRAHIADRVTLADLARHAHVSVSTLSHRYRSETGRAPISRLIELRIDHAKVLLLKGAPLKSIATQLGFTDEFHLSKTFKRTAGISPRTFRRV